MSIKQAVFCDLCGEHITDISEGKSFFYAGVGETQERKFEYTVRNDISFCNSCQNGLYIKLMGLNSNVNTWCPDNIWEDHEEFTTEAWTDEITHGDTRQGYVNWVNHQILQKENT